LLHEKNKRNARLAGSFSLSEDERWSKKKVELEKLESRISKSKDSEQRHLLERQRIQIKNELRNIEWHIRESEMTQLYNANKGNLKKLTETSMKLSERELERNEEQLLDRKVLFKIVKTAEQVVQNEPETSIKVALMQIERDLKAHYKVLSKLKEASVSGVLSDYWVAWMVVCGILNGVAMDPKVERYASRGFRPKLRTLLDLSKNVKLANSSYQSASTSDPDHIEPIPSEDQNP
jgi:hypothetical protein